MSGSPGVCRQTHRSVIVAFSDAASQPPTPNHPRQDDPSAAQKSEEEEVDQSFLGGYSCTAPLDSPLVRLALHCLVCGNPRAVAVLWTRWGLGLA